MISYCTFRLGVFLLLLTLSPVTGKLATTHLPEIGRHFRRTRASAPA